MATPLLNFALIGRKSSGKTCLLTTLALPREPDSNSYNCNLSRSKERYEEYLAQRCVKEFFGKDSVANYEEMLDHIDVLTNTMKEGRLPDATPLTRKTAHIYNIDSPKHINFDMALFDYAGELVEAESKVSDNLLKFLSNMSGLMIIVELEDDNPDNMKKAAMDINNLIQFFKAIKTDNEEKTRFNIPIALLITKFDKHPSFNIESFEHQGRQYIDILFEKYLESQSGKNLKILCNSIAASTTVDNFKIYPVCALGAVKNSKIDIPVKSINVIEPFAWAAENYGKKLLKETDVALNKNGFVSALFNIFVKDYQKMAYTASCLIPDGLQEKEQCEQLELKAKSITKKLYGILLIGIIALILGSEFFIDQITLNINTEKLTISSYHQIQQKLRDYANTPFYRHSLSKICSFSSSEAINKIKELDNLMDSQFWNEISQTTEPQEIVDKLNIYLTIPNAKNAEVAKNKIEKYKIESRKQNWLKKVAELEKRCSVYKTGTVKIDNLSFDQINAELAIIKSEYEDIFDLKHKLSDLEKEYSTVAASFIEEVFEKSKSDIINDINDPNFENWLTALEKTFNLHSKSWLKEEKWAEFANETIMSQLYSNCENLSIDDSIDFSEKLSILAKIQNSAARQSIKNLTGYVENEKEYFETKIYNLKKDKVIRDYNEIADFASGNNRNLKLLISNQKRILEKINELMDFFNNNGDIAEEYKYSIKQLSAYKNCLTDITKPQELRIWHTHTTWPRSNKLLDADKWVRLNLAGNEIKLNIKTDKKDTFWPKNPKNVYILPNEEILKIVATVKDTSSGFKTILCNGGTSNYNNLDLLTNVSDIAIPVKGTVEGLLLNDNYEGVVRFTTEWVSKMCELERLK